MTTVALQGGLADQRHGAMLNDGVAFVPLNHADMEESGIFPIAHALERVFILVAIILRRLHERDFGFREIRNGRAQPIGADDIIAVDNADDFGIRRGLRQREIQSARLKSGPVRQMEKTETRTKPGAMFFKGFPYRFVLRVVVDDDNLEIRVIQLRQRIERFDHHMRRFVVARHMDGNFRRIVRRNPVL